MTAEFTDPVTVVVMATDADTDADGGLGRGGAQQGNGKDGRDQGFHGNLLSGNDFPHNDWGPNERDRFRVPMIVASALR